MGRSLSPILRQELENLDKDADSRKSAMKALKLYVKDLDSKAIPLFLAQVSETKETGSTSGEYTISLYEVLARVHGPKIIPQIDNIMTTIIKTLTSSAGSFALHQACSKVVPAIARYGIDPTTPEDKKRYIIHSLCKPLSDSLLSSQESLSSGSALCLKALVDSDNWRFASDGMVNEVCQRVAGALEKSVQTNSHMGLIMSLAKHNSLIVEAYARLLIQSGLRILNVGVVEGNSQKRLSAIQMINFMMKCLDPKSIISELNLIIEEMERCQSDQMAYVRGAAFEAMQIARKISTEKSSKFDCNGGSATGSNYHRRDTGGRRNLQGAGNRSPVAASPESQTMNSFVGYDSLLDSPISTIHFSGEFTPDRRSVNRKLWRTYENSGVDVSLKDGLYSEVCHGSAFENSSSDELSNIGGDYPDGFAGFFLRSPANQSLRSTTPSPQKSRINVDNIKIYSTPRKLIRSLQDPNDEGTDSSGKETRISPSGKSNWSPTFKNEQNGLSPDMKSEAKSDEKLLGGEQFLGGSESVSSTEDVPPDADLQVSPKVGGVNKIETRCFNIQKNNWKSTTSKVFGFFILLLAVSICFLWTGNQDEGYNLVPT
ncbi:protein SINE1 [Diospyros lotus]|uniref:protein SINE1 n=1 Tax=Diospyros lotus TaxID=55363 RepID=UPI0022506A3A|nr:protein SINE1 [Diospyros lotus]